METNPGKICTKYLGILTFQDGWNGGQWLLDEKPFTLECLHNVNTLCVQIKRKKVFCTLVARFGVDEDMGFRRKWSNSDVRLQLNTEIGMVQYSLLKYLETHRVKVKLYGQPWQW